jgi:hypothetical protein
MNKEQAQIKEAYQNILSVCKKYADIPPFKNNYDFNDIAQIIRAAKNHLEIVRWSEDYGLNFRHDKNINGRSFRIDDHISFTRFEDAKSEKERGCGYYISWEDDGKQPNNEWLMNISFSTGAYFFGQDYPQAIFEKFWQELKSYKPDYCDTANNNLYFKLENAKEIFNKYYDIVKKYKEINKKDSKQRKIKKLEEELAKLK